MSDDVVFVGVKPGEVEFLRVERPQTKKRPPSPSEERPQTKKRPSSPREARAPSPREARPPSPREERPQTKKRPPSPREARYPTAEERAEFERARAKARAELRAKDEAKAEARAELRAKDEAKVRDKAKARAPAPRDASDEASAHFNVGDVVFHKDFSYCKVVAFTLKRVRILDKKGKDHVVSAASLHVQSHNAANTAQLPALRRLRDFKEEDERLSDAYLDGLRYNPAQPWPQGRDSPSPQTKRSAIK